MLYICRFFGSQLNTFFTFIEYVHETYRIPPAVGCFIATYTNQILPLYSTYSAEGVLKHVQLPD